VRGTEDGVPVTRPGSQDQWVRLEPGNYAIRVQPGRAVRQFVHLEKGDYLLVNLRRDPDGKVFSLEPVLDGNDYKRFGYDSREREGWLLTLRHNSCWSTDQSLELLLSLENTRNRLPRGQLDTIRPQPQAVWLEIEPREASAALTLFSWGPFYGYPAPTWRLTCKGWPPRAGTSQPASPNIRVWWSWHDEPASFATIDRPAGAPLASLVGKRAAMPGGAGDVVIEGWEIRDGVEVKGIPGEGLKPGDTALVVRASFSAGTPIWMDPVGLFPGARQHHYSNQAGKYTGVFWPVTRDTVQADLRGIAVYSVEQFKARPGTLRTDFDGGQPSGAVGRRRSLRCAVAGSNSGRNPRRARPRARHAGRSPMGSSAPSARALTAVSCARSICNPIARASEKPRD
jgi:hypothetical protein